MFERFTDRARKVMALANQEAQRFNHEYIGTEHILLGLVKEGGGAEVSGRADNESHQGTGQPQAGKRRVKENAGSRIKGLRCNCTLM